MVLFIFLKCVCWGGGGACKQGPGESGCFQLKESYLRDHVRLSQHECSPKTFVEAAVRFYLYRPNHSKQSPQVCNHLVLCCLWNKVTEAEAGVDVMALVFLFAASLWRLLSQTLDLTVNSWVGLFYLTCCVRGLQRVFKSSRCCEMCPVLIVWSFPRWLLVLPRRKSCEPRVSSAAASSSLCKVSFSCSYEETGEQKQMRA